MLIAAVLTLLAALIATAGILFAGKARKPRMFRIAGFVAAVGLILLWLLPWWAFSEAAGGMEMALVIAAFLVAVSVLGAGLSLMARAATGYVESEADRIIQNFDPYDELP